MRGYAAARMTAWLLLNGWFFLSATVYGLLVAKSFDGWNLPWFPLTLPREHAAVPILKVVPTCTALTLAAHGLWYSQHWFVWSYLIFLVLMVVIDYTIVARPRQMMYLALAAHLLSEVTAVGLVVSLAPGPGVLWFYAATLGLGLLVVPRVIRMGVQPRFVRFVWGYAALLAVLLASFLAVAVAVPGLPLLLRLSFAGAGVFIATTDSLWALREFAGRGARVGVSVTYNLAMWCLATTVLGFAAWVGG